MKYDPIALGALYNVSLSSGATFARDGAWQLATGFGSVEDELSAAHTDGAIGELCGVRTFDLVGADLPALADLLGAVSPGHAATLPGVEMGRWCRLAHDQARILLERTYESRAPHDEYPGQASASDPQAAIAALLGFDPSGVTTAVAGTVGRQESRIADKAASACLHMTDLSSGLMTLAVLGPRSPDLLARLVRIDLDPRIFGDRQFARTGSVGVPLDVLRWDRGSVLVYELTVGRDVAEYFYHAVRRASEKLAFRRIGSEAFALLQERQS